MTKRIFIIVFIGFTGIFVGRTQTAEDAIRYSQLTFGGTARGMGVSGAFGAIGADFTGVLANPAGLGLFRKSQIMFTPQIVHIRAKSEYLGNTFKEDKVNFNAGSFAGVINISYKNKAGVSRRGKWVSTTFAFAYNRVANFNKEIYFSSKGTSNSFLSTYAKELAGTPEPDINDSDNSFEAISAYNAYLVNPAGSDPSSYVSATNGGLVNQVISRKSSGGIDELSFSLANNYNEKLIFGAYVGVPILRYNEDFSVKENDNLNAIPLFKSFELDQTLRTTGVGVNFKAGVIYVPVHWFRLGAAIHTPTYYGLNDEYSSSLQSILDTLINGRDTFPYSRDGEFDYNLSTPFRAVGSLGFIFNQYGFFSFDYEYVDYSNARYSYNNFKTEENLVNSNIKNIAGSAHNFRTGLELAYGIGRIRGGYAHYGSPIKGSKVFDKEGATNSFSVGVGIRLKHFYTDFAYVRSATHSNLYLANETVADKTIKNNFVSTFGVRF